VLIAFAIAALALAALFHGALGGLRAAGIAGQYEEAVARARSHLAALGASLTPGDTQGDDGSLYHWHVHIAPVASTVVGAGLGAGMPATRATLYAVSVAVSWRADGTARGIELHSRRLGTGPAAAP
jgi:hypothetical protein